MCDVALADTAAERETPAITDVPIVNEIDQPRGRCGTARYGGLTKRWPANEAKCADVVTVVTELELNPHAGFELVANRAGKQRVARVTRIGEGGRRRIRSASDGFKLVVTDTESEVPARIETGESRCDAERQSAG